MSTRLKRLVVGIVAALPTTFLFPAQASAAVCANVGNVALVGNADQVNDCETNATLDTGGLPTP
ncbi:MAG: hypothetical protein M3198_03525 [Actinomycetota bacterium]|nr:hypothetical protein [Actinomycetota bacterium]